MAAGPFSADATGVRLALRVTPRASRTSIAGVVREADGSAALKVLVTAAPEDGRANAAVVALLAKRWRLPKAAFRLVAGAADRRKVLHIDGDPAELLDRLVAELDQAA